MTYEEFIKFLNKEFERLEEVEHVSEFLNNEQYKEVDTVISKIDYSLFYSFMEHSKRDIDIYKIPKAYGLISAIYFSGNKKYDENQITGDYEEYAKMLFNYGKVGKCIGSALMMYENTINGFDSIEELIKVGEECLKEQGCEL